MPHDHASMALSLKFLVTLIEAESSVIAEIVNKESYAGSKYSWFESDKNSNYQIEVFLDIISISIDRRTNLYWKEE